MGKPSVVRMRASDSPSSRPPSRRCTDTFTRVPCLGSARCMAVGGGVAVPVESASPLAGCVVSTSLMARRSLAMIAPGHRHPTRLRASLGTSTGRPMAIGRPAPVEHPLGAGDTFGHALHLGRARRERRSARVVAANESVVVVVALEGVDVGVKDREALLADETDCYLAKDV